jgi:hypothetical protein
MTRAILGRLASQAARIRDDVVSLRYVAAP